MKRSFNYLAAVLIGAASLTAGPVVHAQQAAVPAANAAMTDGEIKKGDKVRFTADKVNGDLSVTTIEQAK